MTALLTHPLWGWVVWGAFAFVALAVGEWYGRYRELRESWRERDEIRAVMRAVHAERIRELDEAA